MQNKSSIPVIVQSTVVNLLREYCPGLTVELLVSALSQQDSTTPITVQRKLTRSECAAILGVSVNSINRYIKRGKLRAVNISPRLVRIDPVSVQNLLDHGVPEEEIVVPQCHGREVIR